MPRVASRSLIVRCTCRTVLHHCAVWCGAVLAASVGFGSPAQAVIDLTGRFDVTITVFPQMVTQEWFIDQSGSTLTEIGPYTGTIDPNTGAMTFGGVAFPCDSGGGPDSFTGTAAGDSNSFTATGTMHVPVTFTPPILCTTVSASISATRDPCGNGVLDPGEACDDGDLTGPDCCSFDCTVEPDGTGCEDGDPGVEICLSGTCTPVGPFPEFQVNTYTPGNQGNADVACRPTGEFVIVWEREYVYGPSQGIAGRRYDSDGVALGTELAINDQPGDHRQPAIATVSNGAFVVVWKDVNVVRARRFDSSGVASGTELVVTTDTGLIFSSPDVASSAAGDFVVVWDQVQDVLAQTYARRYASSGAALGSEFHVGTTTTMGHTLPTVASDANGNFVIVWLENQEVMAQRYASSGAVLGTEFRANTYTTGPQLLSSVAAAPDGDFVISWLSHNQDGSDAGMFAQRYVSSGVPSGTEFQVNTHTTTFQAAGQAAIDGNGNFVIAWHSFLQDGAQYGIYAQRYDSSGAPINGEFIVNGFTYGNQARPSVCAAAQGDFIITWTSTEQDGDGSAVVARRYDVPDPDPPVLDHYKCYQGRDLKMPAFAQQSVGTDDQVATETVLAQKLKFVCSPVDKNGEGIADPAAHLACYKVSGTVLSPLPQVELSTQFQSSRFELKKPTLLCLPATKTLLP